MSDSTQPTNQEPNNQPQAQENNAPEQTFSKNDVQKILEEAKKYKSLALDYESKFKQREVDELTKNQKWQELAELKEKEAEKLKSDLDGFKTAFIRKEKLNALKEAALQQGIRKEALSDLRDVDFPEIKLETNPEGDFTVQGADKAIQRLKTLRPFWFQTSAPPVNSTSPVVTGDGSAVSHEAIYKLQDEYKKNPNAANADKLKGALLQFKKQASK